MEKYTSKSNKQAIRTKHFLPKCESNPLRNSPKILQEHFEKLERPQKPLTVESILNQTIWYNSFITIAEQPIKRLFAF